jgi:hypothetical protein
VVATIDTLNVQNCSVTAWAFATLRHDDDALFEALLERVAANIAFCEPQNVANTLWAYARLGRPLGRHAAAFKVCVWGGDWSAGWVGSGTVVLHGGCVEVETADRCCQIVT